MEGVNPFQNYCSDSVLKSVGNDECPSSNKNMSINKILPTHPLLITYTQRNLWNLLKSIKTVHGIIMKCVGSQEQHSLKFD